MKKVIYPSVMFLAVMIVLTGLVYPILITGIANSFFPDKARGSLVTMNGKYIGSKLIGQKFTSDKYFWPRPSVTDYNALPSSGSNLGPLNPGLVQLIHKRDSQFRKDNKLNSDIVIPSGMLTASGSGLDPHISPAEAELQVERIVSSRGFDTAKSEKVRTMIKELTEPHQFMILGEPRINVFLLNLKMDSIK